MSPLLEYGSFRGRNLSFLLLQGSATRPIHDLDNILKRPHRLRRQIVGHPTVNGTWEKFGRLWNGE